MVNFPDTNANVSWIDCRNLDNFTNLTLGSPTISPDPAQGMSLID